MTTATRRTRPAAKTGDPVSDRAAKATATKATAPAKPATPRPNTSKVLGTTTDKPAYNAPGRNQADHEYVLVNGDFRVHKAGCKDLGKEVAQSDYAAPIRVSGWTSEEQAIRDLWSDIIGDTVNQEKDGPVATTFLHEHGLVSATGFAPCCVLTPMDAPAPARKAAAKAAAKAPATVKGTATGRGRNAKGTTAAPKPASKGKQAPAPSDKTAARAAKQALAVRVIAAAGSMPGLSSEDKRTIANWLHYLPTGGQWVPAAILPKPDRSDWR